MRRGNQGSSLIAVLLLISLLLVAGIGLLSRKSVEYRRIQKDLLAAQALVLARSGLQDALLKFGKDINFPPQSAVDQPFFRYAEDLYRSDGRTFVGRYSVTIDRTYQGPPHQIAIITSTGTVGSEIDPSARHSVRAELDLALSRSTYFKLVNYQDLGGI